MPGRKHKFNVVKAVLVLLRFASPSDAVLIIFGLLAAVIHGVALPISLHYFGILTNVFVNQFTSKQLANFEFTFDPAELLLDLQSRFTFIDFNIISSGFINFTNITGGIVNCSEDYILLPPITNFGEALQLGVTELAECLDDETFIEEVNELILVFIIIGIIVIFVATFQVFALQVTSDNQVRTIKQRFFQSVLYHEAQWYDEVSTGELTSRLANDTEKIHEGIGVKLPLFVQWMTTFVAGFVIGFIREWRLTLMLLGVTPFILITVTISYILILLLTFREQSQSASASALVKEVLSNIRTVVAYGGQKNELENYESKLRAAEKTEIQRGSVYSVSLAIIYFLVFVCYAIGFWFSAWLISVEVIQAGDALTVFFVIIIGVFALRQAIPHFEKLISAAGSSREIYQIIDETPKHQSNSPSPAFNESNSAVEFRDITFAYPSRPDVQVLDNFSLTVGAGKTVALVGPSGCGKTTAIQLLLRFYEASSGEVLIGGTDIRSVYLKSLRSQFGFVGQEPVLFDTTVHENIALGKQDASAEEVREAAKDANVHEFVSKNLPEGYETHVGKQGTQMSGGQKQRIAIARALIRNPRILLLDDATSALDSESERIVQVTLDKASQSRTTIIVSHRLSTIRSADVVAYMEKGVVVEMGTHENLMGKKGAYYDFVSTQYTDTDAGPNKEGDAEKDNNYLDDGQLPGSPKSVQEKNADGNCVEMDEMSTSHAAIPQDTEVQVKASWRRIWKMNSPEAFLLFIAVISSVIQGVIYPMFAYFFGQVLRVFTLPFNMVLGEIHVWAGTFLILGAVSGISAFFKNKLFSVSGIRLVHRIRLATFRSILGQEISWFDSKKNSPSLLTSRLANDARLISGANGGQFGSLVESVISILAAVIISLAVNQLLALVIIGFLPFLLVPDVIQWAILNAHTSYYKRTTDEAEKIAADAINNHQTVRALSIEQKLLETYEEKLKKVTRYSGLTGFGYGLTFAFSQAAIFFSYAIAFRFGAYQSVQPINESMFARLENIYTVFMALIFGSLVLGQSNEFAPDYATAMHAAKRVFGLLDRRSAIDAYSEEGRKPDHCTGQISLHNVTFSYPTRPGVNVMHRMNLTATANHSTALVGPSGYGKSTVMSLLERFYEPSEGSVLLDGIELKSLNVSWLRSQIGIVFQEPVLFNRSIAANIGYGVEQHSDREIEQAAKDAKIHDFIISLPMGYETVVGEGGGSLSRGQKQRIAIARALLRNPKLLLLDEATSALDPKSEKEVQQVLDEALVNRTSIVIAHRLSTIHKSHKIAVLKAGQVAEEGTHTDLMEKEGLYYKMYTYQN